MVARLGSETEQARTGTSNSDNKSICLPVLSELADEALLSNPVSFRHYVKRCAAKYSEILPFQIAAGFWFHDFVASSKLSLRMRRIQLLETREVYQLRPDGCTEWLKEYSNSTY